MCPSQLLVSKDGFYLECDNTECDYTEDITADAMMRELGHPVLPGFES